MGAPPLPCPMTHPVIVARRVARAVGPRSRPRPVVLVLAALLAAARALETLPEGFHHDIDETSFSVGSQHACALEVEPRVEFGGKAVCWGNKKFGRLAVVDDVFIQLSVGEFATCGVNLQERVRCWGDFVRDPPESLSFLQVSCGNYHCCGVLQGGALHCWGMDFNGQLQSPSGKFVQVSSGQTHVCAIRTDGTLACWGSNRREVTTPPPGQFLQVSCHTDECCGVRLDGRLVCWGGFTPEGAGFVVHGEEDRFTQVSLGNDFFCAIKEDAFLRCWGSANIVKKAPTVEVVMVAAGRRDVCAVLASDSSFYCWGDRLVPPPNLNVAF